jgi:hypothetical protein
MGIEGVVPPPRRTGKSGSISRAETVSWIGFETAAEA